MKADAITKLLYHESGLLGVSGISHDMRTLEQSAAPEAARSVLTGKERLGRKWTDEQRIDNCNVPIGKRGTKPRPSACPQPPSS